MSIDMNIQMWDDSLQTTTDLESMTPRRILFYPLSNRILTSISHCVVNVCALRNLNIPLVMGITWRLSCHEILIKFKFFVELERFQCQLIPEKIIPYNFKVYKLMYFLIWSFMVKQLWCATNYFKIK
jgi:hypothetical protein